MTTHPNNVEIHRWAEAQPWGHKVTSKGITNQLIAAWNKAHPDRPYVKSEAHHGTAGGYGSRGCRCRPCTDAATAYVTESDVLREAERADR